MGAAVAAVVCGGMAVDVFQHFAFECRTPSSLYWGGMFGVTVVGWLVCLLLIRNSKQIAKRTKLVIAVGVSLISVLLAVTAGFFALLAHMCP